MPASRATGALVDAHLDDLSKAARAVFEELLDGSDPADVLGFALLSDVDGAGVTAAVNPRTRRGRPWRFPPTPFPVLTGDPDYIVAPEKVAEHGTPEPRTALTLVKQPFATLSA